MCNIYIVVYNHPSYTDMIRITLANENTQDFLNAYSDSYYDVGDDPSFYCSGIFKTALSWGVCRPNIRNKIQINDVVVFFCYNSENLTYHLIGLATVKEKIKQTQIWSDENYANYRNHFNLLIRLNNNIWGHYEPLFNHIGQHKNWANRIQSDFPNDIFQYMENSLLLNYSIQNNFILFKENYQDTCLLKHPIPVANWNPGEKNETWLLDTEDSVTIRNMIFNETTRESLRVHPNNQGHVHIRIEKNYEELETWKNSFINFIQSKNNMNEE